MFYHNFTNFKYKYRVNYNELENLETSSLISGSSLLDPAHQFNLETRFNFDDFFNRYTIFKFKKITVKFKI